jgi:hypothetical protein
MIALLDQLFKFARVYRKYWIIPVVILLLIVGGMIVVVQSSAIAPFIYAVF